MIQYIFYIESPFRTDVLSQVHTPAHPQKHLEVGKTTCTNQPFDYMFLLHNWLCLIKICAYSLNRQLLLIINLNLRWKVFWFWKLLILHRNWKVFLLSLIYNHFKGICKFAYTRNKKDTQLKKTSNT